MRRLGALGFGLAWIGLACGPGAGGDTADSRIGTAGGFTLVARAGLFETGSRRGLALLLTLRDAAGRGPPAPWSIELRPPSSRDPVRLDYTDPAEGSFVARWLEELAPEAGRFWLSASGEPGKIALSFEIRDRAGLPPPQPRYDGKWLVWDAPPGAGSYLCRIYSGGALVASMAPSPIPACDPTGLDDGSYTASVVALSVDLAALAADRSAAPELAETFHVSEARVGFLKGESAPGFQLHAAGGSLNFGPQSGGVAVWLALGTSTGGPPAEEWTVSSVGPGISPSSPLLVSFPPGAFQKLSWSYDLTPRSGTYTVIAQAGAKRVATSFTIGDAPSLPIADGVEARPLASGAAEVSWQPVAKAASYYVSVWRSGTGVTAPTAGIWVAAPPAKFAPGTFQAGLAYDVYVAATDADMTLASAPPGRSAVSVSENTYTPASFTAP